MVWDKIILKVLEILEKVAPSFAAFFTGWLAGKGSAEKKQTESDLKDAQEDNENLRDSVGKSDSNLADKLRRRADAKRKDRD